MGRRWFWMPIAAVLAGLIGCHGSASQPSSPQAASIRRADNSGRNRHVAPSKKPAAPGAAAQRAIAPQAGGPTATGEAIEIPYLSDRFGAVLVVRPQLVVSASPLRRSLAGLLDELGDRLPADPRAIEQLAVLVAPLAEDDVSLLVGKGRADQSTDAAERQARESAADNGAEAASNVPELDHLFIGLEPEPPDPATLANQRRRSAEPELELMEMIPPFVAVALRFSRAQGARGFVENMEQKFELEKAECEGKWYFRQHLAPSERSENPLAIHMVDGRTVVVSREQLLQEMITDQPAHTRWADQLRRAAAGDHEAFGLLLLDPIRETAKQLASAVSAGRDEDRVGGAHLADLLDYVAAATIDVQLSGADLAELRLQTSRAGSAKALTKLVRETLDAGGDLATGALDQWHRAAAIDVQPLIDLADQLRAGLSVTQEDHHVIVRLKRPEALAALLEPLVTQARAAAERQRRADRLRRIGVAMLDYCDLNGRLPDNWPFGISTYPVSWRVKLLPYLDRGDLFDQYRFDEPWDSPHNRKLLGQMPNVYGENGPATSVMIFTGEGTPFPGQRLGLGDLSDGLDKTIFAVRAGADKSVPWTQPADLPLDGADPIEQLGKIPDEGFQVILFDGRVITLPSDIGAETLRRLIHPSDGEPVQLNFSQGPKD